MSPDQKHFRGMASMILAGFFFSVMVACVKAVGKHVPISEVVCVRLGVTGVIVAVLMARYRVSPLGVNRPLLILRAVIGTVSIGLNFYAASLIPLVDHSLLLKTSVIFTAIFGALWLKERPSRGLSFYTGIGLLGVAFVVKPTGKIMALGGAAALVAAVLIGWTGAILRRLQETEHSYTIIAVYCWFATLFYLLFFWPVFVAPSGFEWCLLIGSGLAGTLGQIFFTAAYKFSSAGAVSPFLYSEVLFAALLGAVYFGEIPDLFTILGTCITCYAGFRIATAPREK